MDINISNFLIGVIAAALFQFIILAYHVRINKDKKFLFIWLLGTGLVILGYLSNFIGPKFIIEKYIIMIHNGLIVMGHGLYYVSLKEYFKSINNFKKYRLERIAIILLIILSTFSTNTNIRMISTSSVLGIFSILTLILLYKYKSENILESVSILIIANWVNAIFWTLRIPFIYFILPNSPSNYNFILMLSYLSSLMLSILGSLGLILVINQKLEYLLKKESLKLMAILETIPDSVIVTNVGDGKVEFVNDKFAQSLKCSVSDLIGKNTLDAGLWENHLSRDICLDNVSKEANLCNYEDYLYAKDGSRFLASISSRAMIMEGEEYVVSVLRDVSEVREIEKNLMESEKKYKNLADQFKKEKEIAEKISLTDEMTGLANRRYLQDRILFEFARMKRTGLELSLIMIDVDFFKAYNDTYGHIKGDESLKAVAKVIKDSVKRATDLKSRYGGEEFVILLPDTDRNSAKRIAEKVRKSIQTLGIEHKASEVADVLTVSAGVVTFEKDSCSCPTLLLEKVDKALYLAKESGRNIVIQV